MAMTLHTFHALARSAGAAATHVAKVATFGTRRHPNFGGALKGAATLGNYKPTGGLIGGRLAAAVKKTF